MAYTQVRVNLLGRGAMTGHFAYDFAHQAGHSDLGSMSILDS